MKNVRLREPKGKKLLLNLEKLDKIKQGLHKLRISKGSRLSVWAGCLVGFWGAFRLGELFAKGKKTYDRYSDLLWEDVTWLPQRVGVRLSIKSGKIPGPPGNNAELHSITARKFCPIRALYRLEIYQKTSGIWESSSPIFRRSSGRNLTRNLFLKTVNAALKKTGMEGATLTGKSFRSGILSALSSCPEDFHERHLKSLGRWKSGAYRFYTWNGPVGFRKVFEDVSNQLLRDFHFPQVVKKESGPASGSSTQRVTKVQKTRNH
jgi:hypothetical protein